MIDNTSLKYTYITPLKNTTAWEMEEEIFHILQLMHTTFSQFVFYLTKINIRNFHWNLDTEKILPLFQNKISHFL